MVESLGDAAIRLVSLITGATDMSNEPTSPARDAGAVPRVREKSPTNSPGRKKNGMDLSLSACDGYPLMATILPPPSHRRLGLDGLRRQGYRRRGRQGDPRLLHPRHCQACDVHVRPITRSRRLRVHRPVLP